MINVASHPPLDRRIAALGPVAQLAFVPQDFQGCIDFWTDVMGVGPFVLLEHIRADQTLYLGEPVTPDFSVAVSYWHDMQIEIIRQHDDTPSIYSRWHRQGRTGLHHVLIVVEDMAEALALCREVGAELLQEASFRSGSARVAYLQAGGEDGLMVELWQGDDAGRTFFAGVHEQARHWDGRDPLRPASSHRRLR